MYLVTSIYPGLVVIIGWLRLMGRVISEQKLFESKGRRQFKVQK